MTLVRYAALAASAAAICLAAAAPAPPAAAPAPPPPSAAEAAGHPSEVSLSDTRRIAFVSQVNGHGYSIDVALPSVPPPPKGYPVIYLFDGDGYFGSMAEAVRMNGNAPQAIVVGIGYPHDAAWPKTVLDKHQPLAPAYAAAPPHDAAAGLARMYDLTLPASEETLKAASGGVLTVRPQDVGGIDELLKTIETDIKPRVYALAPVDKSNQTLFGHSLGGLAVVEALFTEPQAFRTFVAASPSIWWGDEAVLKHEAAFDAAITSGQAAPRVLITVGSEEETLPALPPSMAAQKAVIEAMIKKDRMVGNACDLAKRLQALHGAAGYQVADCAVFAGQQHGISPWPAMGRAVSFAFPQ